MSKDEKVIVLAIKPKYAEKIYSGKKRWEFRKVPPPVPSWVLLYESAPVSKITGMVYLATKVQGLPELVWDMVGTKKTVGGSAGITDETYRDYVGKAKSVAACMTFNAERFDTPLEFQAGSHPPQNWGRYLIGRRSEK